MGYRVGHQLSVADDDLTDFDPLPEARADLPIEVCHSLASAEHPVATVELDVFCVEAAKFVEVATVERDDVVAVVRRGEGLRRTRSGAVVPARGEAVAYRMAGGSHGTSRCESKCPPVCITCVPRLRVLS